MTAFDRSSESAKPTESFNPNLNFIALQSTKPGDTVQTQNKTGNDKTGTDVTFNNNDIYKSVHDARQKEKPSESGAATEKDAVRPVEADQDDMKQWRKEFTVAPGVRRGTVTEEKFSDGTVRKTLKDKDGKPTYESTQHKDRDEFVTYENGVPKERAVVPHDKNKPAEIYTYDKDGKVVSRKDISHDGTKSTTTFGPTGNPERRETTRPDGSTRSERFNQDGIATFTSEKDKDGTTRRTTHRQDGTPEFTDVTYPDGSRGRRHYDHNGGAPTRETRRWQGRNG